jgi:ferredoxin-NADP reductase
MRLQPGDSLTVFKIKGGFVLPHDQLQLEATEAPAAESLQPVALIAGGIGITPFRSMLRDISQRRLDLPLSLLHVSRDEFLFQPELEALPFEQRRVSRVALHGELDRLATAQPSALFYAAGATSFVQSVQAGLVVRGIEPERIKLDDFEGYLEY